VNSKDKIPPVFCKGTGKGRVRVGILNPSKTCTRDAGITGLITWSRALQVFVGHPVIGTVRLRVGKVLKYVE